MANQEHLDLLKQKVKIWNQWRKEHADIRPDLVEAYLRDAILKNVNLSNADLYKADLSNAELSNASLIDANLTLADIHGANLSGANLSGQDLSNKHLRECDLRGASLSGANLTSAYLARANLSGANLSGTSLSGASLIRANLSGQDLSDKDLRGTNFRGANLSGVSLRGANLSGANLNKTTLVGTNLANTTLKDCTIYGIAVWDVQLNGAEQINLTITPENQPTITVDNLKIAQFIYLLLNNAEIRDVISTLTTKSVLILGRFTPERKAVLDAIRDELRKHNYLPLLFDFDAPINRDISETVTTLARLARFVIADLTDAKSIPQELAFIVPDLPSVPVQPLLLASENEYSMFEHFKRYPWVLPVYRYLDEVSLLQSLKKHVIEPAEQKVQELEKQ